jgi:hypothetical protein
LLGHKLLKKISTTPVCVTTRENGRYAKVSEYLFLHITVPQIPLSLKYTNQIEMTHFVQKMGKNKDYKCAVEPTKRKKETLLP